MKIQVHSGVSKILTARRALGVVVVALTFFASSVVCPRPATAQANQTRADASEQAGDLEIESAAKRGLQIARTRSQNSGSSSFAFQKKGGTDYSGLWAGRYVLVQATCTGFSPSFLFRHQLQLIGNRVALATSHDGTLLGMTRSGGKRVEAATQYVRANNVVVQAVVIYDRNMGTSSATGLGVRVTGPAGACVAAYGANAIRQFGF